MDEEDGDVLNDPAWKTRSNAWFTFGMICFAAGVFGAGTQHWVLAATGWVCGTIGVARS